MSETNDSPDRAEFAKWVRDALNRLYDSPFLAESPLGAQLVAPALATGQRSQDLRRALLNAIQSLRPSKETPPQSPDWRGYQLLEMLYIAGMTQSEAMRELGWGRTLYFTEKARILETLVNRLWDQRLTPGAAVPASGDDELLRLARTAALSEIDAAEVVRQLEPLLSAMLHAKNSRLELNLDLPLCVGRGNRMILRQIILSLVSSLVENMHSGELFISSRQELNWQGFELTLSGVSALEITLREKIRLVSAEMGARLHLLPTAAGVQVRLGWPLQPLAPVVFLVDDNAGTMDLVTRYLEGTPWQLRWAANGQQARAMLTQPPPPNVILLDVILPDEDGWELLWRFKADPALRGVPVIVCSALREEALAATLGANAYLFKPFSQPDLIRALKPWEAPLPTEAPLPSEAPSPPSPESTP